MPLSLPRLPVGLQPTDLFRGEGRDLFPRWAPAFAGVAEFFEIDGSDVDQ
jgi:hypothetical protein